MCKKFILFVAIFRSLALVAFGYIGGGSEAKKSSKARGSLKRPTSHAGPLMPKTTLGNRIVDAVDIEEMSVGADTILTN